MTRLVFHVDESSLPSATDDDVIHIWLYGPSAPYPHIGTVGAQAYEAACRLRVRPSAAAIDFLSIAMAVTAADTFVLRDKAPDGWSRSFDIVLPLVEPAKWQAVKAELKAALLFLSSDHWNFEFISGGVQPPSLKEIKRRQKVIDVSKVDCVSLFSGGLDSGIGALDLLASKKRILLVSHAAHGDADKQEKLAQILPVHCQRMPVNTYPTLKDVDDDSMRTRSFQFIALGVLAAQAVSVFRGGSKIDMFVCENGLIGLNPPLTPRRMGSHSTRTAHPHFLGTVDRLLLAVGLPAAISNPYRHITKGEMIAKHANDKNFAMFVGETVSCGKWKRENKQCGRCVPCLIRRASLHHAGVRDLTHYQYPDLQAVMQHEDSRDDLIAMQTALIRGEPLERWIAKAGPLPSDSSTRQAYVDVVKRGMEEVKSYLVSEGFSF